MSPPDEEPLVSLSARGPRFDLRLGLAAGPGERRLVLQLYTAFRDAPLRLFAPLEGIGPGDWHDAVVRCHGHRIELRIDGVLADEEWPAGVPSSTVSAAIRMGGTAAPGAEMGRSYGEIDRVALWDRCLSDEEIAHLSGGPEAVARREIELLGPEEPVGQGWAPRGFNTGVGDCMPFYDGRRYHLFYLFDRRAHRSKWGLGAHQWAHVSTADLRDWEMHPLAVPITDEREGSICTGSVFLHDGTYRAYYAVRTIDGSEAPLGVALSRDGVDFTRTPWAQTLPAPYLGPSARDPHVFRDPRDGRFHMLVTTSLIEPGAPPRGCLAHLISRDLDRWEPLEPFLVPDLPGEPECPEWFGWNGWYYLVFSIEGIARYRMSREPLGPWAAPEVDTFGGPTLGVMKSAAYRDGRRLGAGFLRRPEGYAGRVIFREILQGVDGTLTTDWPPELPPKPSEASE